MKKNECDIGFVNLPIADDEDIVIDKSIVFLNDIFIGGERFSELKGKELSVRDLQNIRCCLWKNIRYRVNQ